jgi:peptidoglycan/LPS O-acetylase OafA/YrhL
MTTIGSSPEVSGRAQTAVSIGAGSGRELYLDAFRAIACMMVFFYHEAINLWIFGVPIYGCYGVHLFFVLSGYLLGGRYIDAFVIGRPLPLAGNYLIKRFLRIYPPYAICLTCFIALRVVGHVKLPTFGNWLAHYLLIFNYFDRYDFFSINNVVWSLAVEMQFYLILPLVGFAVERLHWSGRAKGWIFAMGLILVGVGSRWFECKFIDHYDPRAVALIRFKWATSYLDLFAVGILARRIELTVAARKWLRPKAGAVQILLFVSGLCLCWGVGRWSLTAGRWQSSSDLGFLVVAPILVVIAFGGMVLAAGSFASRNSVFFRLTELAALGQISYSVYLYHTGVQFVVGRFVPVGAWRLSFAEGNWTTALIALPITLIIASVSYRWVEKPSIALASRLTAKGDTSNGRIAGVV